mgnify:CR=1 FL=1
MKRRDFLIKTAGLAGVAVPALTRAQNAPCPPPLLSAQGGTSATTSCEKESAGTAPKWFLDMPDNTWATPVVNRLDDVKPSPLPPGVEGQAAVCDDWTGGTVDQGRGEFILPAQGGHNGYYGNEVYAVALRDPAPAWRRVWGPSPNSSISTSGGGFNVKGAYADGQPRPVHGWNRPCCSSDGRVWLAGLDAMGSPEGFWSTACWSFDNRSRTGWTYHGLGVPNPPKPFGSAFSWQGGPAAYDRVTNRVWAAAEYAVSDGGYSVDVATNEITRYNWVLPGNPFGGAWSVIAYDLRVWIVGSVHEKRLWILNLDNVSAGWIQKTTSGSPAAFDDGVGAVYHRPSRAILCWKDTYGASIRKLTVPADPFKGTYTWSTVNPAAANTVIPAPNPRYPGRTYSKFQIIEDMGNGRSALCTVNSTVGATYVYKLPEIV